MNDQGISVREVSTFDEFDACIALQREAFDLPELEVSPRRHFIVTANCGGWTLGAFVGESMVGFVHHLIAVRQDDEIIGYSHMMGVAREYQNRGVGALLKWAQRERALAEGRKFIRWTWDPMLSRNAHFNLNRLGVIVRKYTTNFYGTDFLQTKAGEDSIGLDSDRLIAEWELRSESVEAISNGGSVDFGERKAEIVIPSDWSNLVTSNRARALAELLRVRGEFKSALNEGLVCRAFRRDEVKPRYLFY